MHTFPVRSCWPATRSGACSSSSYADRYPAEVAGVALIDSMHPKQTHTAADMDRVLAVAPTIARTGIARLLLDPKDGRPVDQARQFVRDVAQMPAELDRAARLKTLGDRPLGVVTASDGSQPGWAKDQDDAGEAVEPELPPHGRRLNSRVPGSRSG